MKRNLEKGKTEIDPVLCSGCGVCLNICPKDAVQCIS
jgi:Pyruvate/2-oxoacid:ferredoxin oxidoreductase delta subunit